MSPPKKIPSPPGGFYDQEAKVCRMPATPVCSALNEESVSRPSQDTFQNISRQRLARHAFKTLTQVETPGLFKFNPLSMSIFRGLMGVPACNSSTQRTDGVADPISRIEAITGETTLNKEPIAGKVRQVALSYNESHSVTAWSLEDFLNPDRHGTFAVSGEGGGLGKEILVNTTGSIHNNTSVAVLDNGEAVVSFSRVEGPEVPSSLIAQRLDLEGNPIASELEILSPEIRTTFPEAQLLAIDGGFLAVYRDGNGKLMAATYDETGSEGAVEVLSETKPQRFQIARGVGDHWALAEIVSGTDIRVRTFQGVTPAGIDQDIFAGAMPSTLGVSIGMQEDGSLMVAWNALQDGSKPVLQGAFLDASGKLLGEPALLRNLVIGVGNSNGTEDFNYNSHGIASDHHGNFIFAFEENRNIIAYVYEGKNLRANLALSNISSRDLEASGPYADVLAGLQNRSVQNVDLKVAASPEGNLSFVYTKVLSGVEPSDNSTVTLQAITRRDYQILYK